MRGTVAWQERGRCRDLDTDLFYPPIDHETPRQRRAREAAAKAVCSGCPVRGECLAWALSSGERLGVWGGTNEREREAMLSGHRHPAPRYVVVR